jgi:hypothetical protein
MYSDSRFVIDALAEFIETVVQRHQSPTVSDEYMTQVRYIMQVDDEASFRSNISPQTLISIESKEMDAILEELISAIGLQRFRFVERQNNGKLVSATINESILCVGLTGLSMVSSLTLLRYANKNTNSGDHDVCRNLTRIAASACTTVTKARS